MARPNLSYLKNLLLFLFGLPCGLLTGLTGIGNSVVVAPLVGYLLGLRAGRAVGTALAVTFFAALASLLAYAQEGYVYWGVALAMAVGQIVGVTWGARLLVSAPALRKLSPLWALLVVALGIVMVWQGLPPAKAQFARSPVLPPSEVLLLLWALCVSVLVGIVSRVIELGGVLIVPAMIYLLPLPPHIAQGIALVVLLVASLPGMLIHARRAEVEPQGATWMSAGAVFGGLAGAYYATHLFVRETSLLLVFGLVLTLIGLMMLWRRERVA